MRRVLVAACVVVVLSAGVRSAHGQPGFSAQAVDQAIDKAIAFLWSRQKPDGGWGAHGGGKYPLGPTSLVAYSLLESGVSVEDPKMAKALGHLAYTTTTKTYTLGLRANVYLAATQKDARYRKALLADVVQIIRSTKNGSYNYDCKADGKSSGDNSNSQYGLLGVWAGARARGVEIPKQYWQLVWKHWIGCQGSDGGWSYRKGESRATMTAAGVASLFVCYDNLLLFDSGVARCRPSGQLINAQKPIQAGLDWFDRNFGASLNESKHQYYYLYGVERVGLASGYKYFGKVDWYKMGVTKLLQKQAGNGSWGNSVNNTAFGLLFLLRGRNTVAFNKLRFTGDWNNRPRDMANLTRWLSKTVEGTVNWQIINTSVPVTQWHDAPILYVSGSKAPKFTDAEITSLRTFVHQGGTIFAVTECRGGAFTEGMYGAYRKLFPDYKVQNAPTTHPLYTVHYNLRGRPRFRIVSNGVRPLVIHATDDLSLAWQHNSVATKKHMFQAAANVFMYVTDKLSSMRRRGTTLWLGKARGGPKRVTMVKVKYKGNYDPEPLACERFSRMMAREHSINVAVKGPTAAADLAGTGAKLAVLVGTEAITLTAAEIKALKAFVAGGGTLLIEAAGGDTGAKGFIKSVEAILARMYPDQQPRKLRPSDPLYKLPGMKISSVRWRRGTRVKMVGMKDPMLRGIAVGKRHGVLLTKEDITAGLAGYPSYDVYGYHPGDETRGSSAFHMMRNIILYAHGTR